MRHYWSRGLMHDRQQQESTASGDLSQQAARNTQQPGNALSVPFNFNNPLPNTVWLITIKIRTGTHDSYKNHRAQNGFTMSISWTSCIITPLLPSKNNYNMFKLMEIWIFSHFFLNIDRDNTRNSSHCKDKPCFPWTTKPGNHPSHVKTGNRH